MLITINSKTSGKFKRRKINGRDHIVTKIMPIRGDTSMNRIMYPNSEVQKSFQQLNNLIAPSSHPVVNGQNVSAYHPLAINANNIGAFLQNPTMKAKEVIADFVIDVEQANNSDDGIETIRRIEAGEEVGVSTGLTINQLTPKNGTDDFGKTFDQEGSGFSFDHVAVLLNEEAAGQHAGTQLITNNDIAGKDKEVAIINLNKMIVTNELTVHQIRGQLEDLISTSAANTWVWVEEIFPESRRFVFQIESNNESSRQFFQQTYAIDDSDTVSLLDDRKEVTKKIEFVEVTNNQKVDDMDQEKLVLALITNGLTGKDKDQLMAMSESELAKLVTKVTTTDEAKTILTNSGFDFEAFEFFMANKSQFEAFQAAEKTKLDDIRKDIVANSDYTDEMLSGKDEAELLALKNLTSNKAPSRLPPQGATLNSQQSPVSDADAVLDYTFA